MCYHYFLLFPRFFFLSSNSTRAIGFPAHQLTTLKHFSKRQNSVNRTFRIDWNIYYFSISYESRFCSEKKQSRTNRSRQLKLILNVFKVVFSFRKLHYRPCNPTKSNNVWTPQAFYTIIHRVVTKRNHFIQNGRLVNCFVISQFKKKKNIEKPKTLKYNVRYDTGINEY